MPHTVVINTSLTNVVQMGTHLGHILHREDFLKKCIGHKNLAVDRSDGITTIGYEEIL